MTGLSVGSGILASVVFLALVGLAIFTIILWKDIMDGTGLIFSTITYTSLTVGVAFFLAFILGFF